MRSSNKRSRNKNNNRRNNNNSGGGNMINRVFDSSGPEGRVRGTPQQIIEKYTSLADDAQRSGDRIAYESFLQFAEHYQRILTTAQREVEERKEAQMKAQQQRQQHADKNAPEGDRKEHRKEDAKPQGTGDQPDLGSSDSASLFPAEESNSDLVETPESKAAEPRKPRAKRPPKPVEVAETPKEQEKTESVES